MSLLGVHSSAIQALNVLTIVFIAIITTASSSSFAYYVQLGSSYTWYEAKQACEDYGTALATIKDSADNTKVVSACTGYSYCWIGLTTQNDCDGCWYWLGEHTSTYTTWYSGNPSTTSNACVVMYDYYKQWRTLNCEVAYGPAICNPNTEAPTAAPSSAPTFNPTINGDDCEERGYIYHYNWDNTSTVQSPYFDYSIDINPNDLSVSIDVNLEYIGYSIAKFEYGLGSTYVLDFKSFDGFIDHIDEPRNCSNRISSSYINKTFSEYWLYSTKPYQYHHYGIADYLAYPPSGTKWTLTMDAGNPWIECARIEYKAKFNWIELNQCMDNNGDKLMNIEITSDFITLSGRFYIDLVSPKSNDKEVDIYYVKPLLQKSFAVKVSRSVDSISSSNIESFLITIYQSYRLFDFTYSTYGAYLIKISTQIADYMQLTFPLVITSPKYQWQIRDINNEDCIFERDVICTQYWEIYMPSVVCPVTFSGLFHLHFSAICNSQVNNTEACDDYIRAYNASVELEFILSYTDPFECNDTNVERINFQGSMLFYINNKFTDLTGNTDQFRSGIDIIYGEIIINIPNNALSIFVASLLNIWICTVNPINEDQVLIDIDNPLFSGCFDSDIVDSGSTQNVMINQVSQLNFDSQIINSDNATNIVRYSFLTPSWAARNKLYIHCQVKISLIESDDNVARRLLDEENKDIPNFGDVQSIVHVIKSIYINNHLETTTTVNINIQDEQLNANDMNLLLFVFIAVIILLIFVIIIYCIYYIRRQRINKSNSVNKQVEQSNIFHDKTISTKKYQQCRNEIIQTTNLNKKDVCLDGVVMMESEQVEQILDGENVTNSVQYVD